MKENMNCQNEGFDPDNREDVSGKCPKSRMDTRMMTACALFPQAKSWGTGDCGKEWCEENDNNRPYHHYIKTWRSGFSNYTPPVPLNCKTS